HVGIAVDVAPYFRQLAMAVGIERVELARLGQDHLEDARARTPELQSLVMGIPVGHPASPFCCARAISEAVGQPRALVDGAHGVELCGALWPPDHMRRNSPGHERVRK